MNAILLIGGLSVIAPLFGRKALVWLVDAGGLGIVIAYGMVALSFIVLRRREPNMPRPFTVSHGHIVGPAALVFAIGIALLYMPGSPAALVWPYEWALVLGWIILGTVFFLVARNTHDADAVRLKLEGMAAGNTQATNP